MQNSDEVSTSSLPPLALACTVSDSWSSLAQVLCSLFPSLRPKVFDLWRLNVQFV